MYKNWRLETDDDGIAWLTIDAAEGGANVLSMAVFNELNDIVQELQHSRPKGLAIISGKDSGFIAGADVKSFAGFKDAAEALPLIRQGQDIFDRLEALPFPTVALIHGFCLGGGLELSLACRYRVATDARQTRIGLPEVRLGIHPGFGGSVRLTRLIGPLPAMNLILTGRTVDGRRAKRLGMVDSAVPERHLINAGRHIILHKPQAHHPGLLAGLGNLTPVRPLIANIMRRKVAAKARLEHYPAPYAQIDVWQQFGSDKKAMMSEEGASVARLICGDTAQNLIRAFFLQERMKALGKASDLETRHVHVIGAGAMGGDIAAWCAYKGFTVTLQDRAPEYIAPAMKRAAKLYRKRLKKPRLVQAAMDRLIPDISGQGVARADVVIEAIIENIEAKQGLYRELEPQLKPDAVLATNTSSIPLEILGEALTEPQRLVGLHFFNPVAQMQLVEIVSGEGTDAEVAKRAAAFVKQIDRLPLPVKSSPGFLVNRILMPYLMEAVALADEGVPHTAIDQAAVDFGMPMGPILLADTVGLDICLSVGEILAQGVSITVPDLLRHHVSAGRLGRKSGRGFYRFKNGKPDLPKPDPGYQPPLDITDRLILSIVNEAVACLREGVVEDADLLDAGMIFGTGFAPFRGGPMQYLQTSGRERLHKRIDELKLRHGDRFVADAGWGSIGLP